MRGTVLYGPRDVRFEELPDPTIVEPTDAIISLPLTCVCGSDLWPYRGTGPVTQPTLSRRVGNTIRRTKPNVHSVCRRSR